MDTQVYTTVGRHSVVLNGDEAWFTEEWESLNHGTVLKYNKHDCRCALCKMASRLGKQAYRNSRPR